MKALIKNGIIRQVADVEFVVHPDYEWVDCPDDCNTFWSFQNGLFIPPVPIIEPEDLQAINRKKFEAMWKFCDSGDRTDINAVKLEESKVSSAVQQ